MAAELSTHEDLGGIPAEKFDLPCQDEHLCQIAREMSNWPLLVPFLGIKLTAVEAIREKWPFNVPAQNLELLRQWQQKHQQEHKDTYRNLYKAFKKAEKGTLAEKVCDILRGQGSSSETSLVADRKRDDVVPTQVEFPFSSSKHETKEVRIAPGSSLYRINPLIPTTVNVDVMESFANYLRLTYEVQIPDFVVVQWPPPPTLKVFNLAMIHSHDTIRRQLPDEELVRLMQRGNIGDATRGKASVQLQNLFKLDTKKHKVILIEGAPGAGKSTLAWHICQKWKDQELFQEFKVVIYVQLRDPEIQKAQSLSDLLPIDCEDTKAAVTAHIKGFLGLEVLFVMDGWDEYKPGLQKGSFLEQLICSPHKVRLHSSTLLITSRPVASAKLQPYASSRVEIMGFTPGEVQRYFEEALRDPLTFQNLHDQLRDRPVIEASCYLPLNAAIVAHLFMELNHVLPTTLHGIFLDVVCGCIQRSLKRITGKDDIVQSLNKLPPNVQKEFESMCTLAYEGSMMNKVTFSEEDLCSYGVSSELDLMQVVRSFGRRDSTLSHFLHLSVQELLTALHISKLPPSEQVRIFNELFDNPRFAAVFRFYAAFTKLQTEGIKDIVAKIAQSRGKMESFLNLMHCLYEAQDISLCCFVASQLKAEVDLHGVITLSPLDCLSVGYFLSCIPLKISGEFRVNLGRCSLDDYRIRFLAKGLSNCVGSTSGMKASNLRDPPPGQLALSLLRNNIGGVGVRCISDIISQSSVISDVDLSGNEIHKGEDGLKYLLQALRTNTSVSKFVLGRCRLRYDQDSCQLLVNMLKENTTLKYVDLSYLHINKPDELLLALGEGLKENRGLKTLVLYGLGKEKRWRDVVLCLTENRCLTRIVMSYATVDVCEAAESVNKIRCQKGLPLLEIYNGGMRICGETSIHKVFVQYECVWAVL